jgi:DNA-binding IclR family transcriptional regulator
MVVPANASSMGKAIAAFQTEERREKPRRSQPICHPRRAGENALLCRAGDRCLSSEFESFRAS